MLKGVAVKALRLELCWNVCVVYVDFLSFSTCACQEVWTMSNESGVEVIVNKHEQGNTVWKTILQVRS